jgi:alkylation response protein AidB-like acyl-CoA dehydrogenase
VAVLGEDGRSAEKLMDAAEEARFAAAAGGIGVIRAVPDDAFEG